MARMHSRDKGKSGSTKPHDKTMPKWVSYKPAEIEALVVKLGKDKLTPAMIGLKLRDQYGVPDVKAATGKRVVEILAAKDLTKSLPQDLLDMIQKAVNVKKHLEINAQDKPARRGLHLAESKVRRLVKYYKSTGKLADDWRYDSKNAGVYLE